MTSFSRNMIRGGTSLFLVVFCSVFFSGLGYAADAEKSEETTAPSVEVAELNFEVVKGDYEYQIENRPDPFVPFYTGEAATAPAEDPNEIIETGERLTGMQLFEPGQLSLVALMKAQGTFIAMVEDFKGQGYVIREGTKIGRRGTVKQIVSNKVIIEEVAVTRAGKELRSEIVMALRKEGEE